MARDVLSTFRISQDLDEELEKEWPEEGESPEKEISEGEEEEEEEEGEEEIE